MDITQTQEFFFKAMLEGWSAGGPRIQIPDMPGYKAIPFHDGDFYLLDCYCVIPNSPKSVGATTIWFQDAPVWVMNYGGLYEEKVIPFLKTALLVAYKADQFFGGRGLHYFSMKFSAGSFTYVNNPRHNFFSKFEGREEIFNSETGASLGWHEYWGMSLI